MDDRFEVVVGAGTSRSGDARAVRFPHRWTAEGVTVEPTSTVRNCCTSRRRDACSTTCTGRPTGITYAVQLHSSASVAELDLLLDVVDAVAEIPRAIEPGQRYGGTSELPPPPVRAAGYPRVRTARTSSDQGAAVPTSGSELTHTITPRAATSSPCRTANS